jgi:hypothetical protein
MRVELPIPVRDKTHMHGRVVWSKRRPSLKWMRRRSLQTLYRVSAHSSQVSRSVIKKHGCFGGEHPPRGPWGHAAITWPQRMRMALEDIRRIKIPVYSTP